MFVAHCIALEAAVGWGWGSAINKGKGDLRFEMRCSKGNLNFGALSGWDTCEWEMRNEHEVGKFEAEACGDDSSAVGLTHSMLTLRRRLDFVTFTFGFRV
jgi:hypothetical protein